MVIAIDCTKSQHAEVMCQLSEVNVQHKLESSARPVCDLRQWSNIDRIALRIDADPVSFMKAMVEAYGFSVHQQQVYLACGNPKRFNSCCGSRSFVHRMCECNLPMVYGEMAIQLGIESKRHARHAEM